MKYSYINYEGISSVSPDLIGMLRITKRKQI